MDGLDLIEICPTQQLHKLMYQIIDELCGREAVNESDFVPNVWPDVDTLRKAVTSWKQFFRYSTSIRGKSEINAEISDDKRKIVYECIEVRKGEIRNGIIDEIVRTSKHRPVHDFDWQLKVILSSDKMANLNESVVNLDLAVNAANTDSDDQELQVISLELNKEELTKLITVLQDAQLEMSSK